MAIESGRPFCLRPPLPGATDPELLWGSVLSAGGLLGAAWLRSGLPTPRCPFHVLTGFPCPTCGMTRACGCLLRGDLLGAFLWNPLGCGLLLGAMAYVVYATATVILRLPRVRWRGSGPRGWRPALFLLAAGNWIYLIGAGRV